MNEDDKSIDLARLQEAARKLSDADGTAAGGDSQRQAALAALRRRNAPAPVLRPDGSMQRPKPTTQEVDLAKLREAVTCEKPIGPTNRFNQVAVQEADAYDAAQARALAKLKGRGAGDDDAASKVLNQDNEPER